MHVVATAGHVDHGKSTLVRALTGTDPDRLQEEKARGLTIDLGFASLELPSGKDISFIDVPGHVRFLKNMLAGTGGIDASLFVVAATEGWKPQSEEHLQILSLLGIRHGLIALTKIGQADEELIELAELDVAEHVHGTFLADAAIVGVDPIDGLGIKDLLTNLEDLCVRTPTATDNNKPRLWIDRVFAVRGAGTVVTGTLTGGSIHVEDQLLLLPQACPVRVRALQSRHIEHNKISPGNRVAVNLSGIGHDRIARGDVLVVPDQWHITQKVDASLNVLGAVDRPVTRRGAHVAYFGSGEYPVRLRVLGPDTIKPGDSGSVRLYLPVGLPLVPGDRFVVRESGRGVTVGGGEVLDVDPILAASRATPDRNAHRVVAERGRVTVDLLEQLTGQRHHPDVGHWVVAKAEADRVASGLRDRVGGAGPLGLDIALLDDFERAVLDSLDDLETFDGYARWAGTADPMAEHYFVAELELDPFNPPEPTNVDRNELRQLARRGEIVESAGVYFAASAIEQAAVIVAGLLASRPDGITVAEARDAWATTRKFAIPLMNTLDQTGVTRRRGDRRIPGPRLPEHNPGPVPGARDNGG